MSISISELEKQLRLASLKNTKNKITSTKILSAKTSFIKKPYVFVKLINSKQERLKAKYSRAPLYLEVIHGVEGDNQKVLGKQLIPLTCHTVGNELRFDGQVIGGKIGKIDPHATVVLTGSLTASQTASRVKLGASIYVHVPTCNGGFYFELNPKGEIKLCTVPPDLNLTLFSFGAVETARGLTFKRLFLSAKTFETQHPILGQDIRIITIKHQCQA